MLIIALLACSPTPSQAEPERPTVHVDTSVEHDDFAALVSLMRHNGCTARERSCVIAHYGIMEDGTDYVFSGVLTSAKEAGPADNGMVDMETEMQGRLWWVHPARPLVDGLDGIGCSKQTPCMSYVENDTLRVWSLQADKSFSIPAGT